MTDNVQQQIEQALRAHDLKQTRDRAIIAGSAALTYKLREEWIQNGGDPAEFDRKRAGAYLKWFAIGILCFILMVVVGSCLNKKQEAEYEKFHEEMSQGR